MAAYAISWQQRENFQSFTMICGKSHVASSICLRATIFQNPEGTLWTHCMINEYQIRNDVEGKSRGNIWIEKPVELLCPPVGFRPGLSEYESRELLTQCKFRHSSLSSEVNFLKNYMREVQTLHNLNMCRMK
jgi:hypothetical protein